MPLIEAALAFAITMLALSLIVSSFVEIIHRTCKMREKGLKYMLEQLYDQVLIKYVKPSLDKVVRNRADKAKEVLVDATTEHAGRTYKTVRAELDAYGNGLEEKPEIVALSKVDLLDEAAEALCQLLHQAVAGRRRG